MGKAQYEKATFRDVPAIVKRQIALSIAQQKFALFLGHYFALTGREGAGVWRSTADRVSSESCSRTCTYID
jgi:hypothetical protein